MGIYQNNDINIPAEQIMPTSVLKNDLFGWFNPSRVWTEKLIVQQNRFLAKIHNKLPYPLKDKRLALGKIPLGKLTHSPSKELIKQNRYIHSIIAT